MILAANHSGNAFPHDGIVLDAALWCRDGMRPSLKFRTVYEPELTQVWWMRPFGIDDFWRRGGGVDMTFDNFERLIERGERVLYFPEGVPGIGKGFNRRYQLQPFKTSFVLLAGRHRVPVYPVYAINAEWVHPFGYCFPPLDRLMQRVFHVPFLPLPIGLLACVIPVDVVPRLPLPDGVRGGEADRRSGAPLARRRDRFRRTRIAARCDAWASGCVA